MTNSGFRCRRCKKTKPATLEFFPRAAYKRLDPTDILDRVCRECHRKRKAAWVKANPGRQAAVLKRWKANNPEAHREQNERNSRKQQLKRYGITEEDYQFHLRRQGGRCAICRRKPDGVRLHVDHDHRTGRIRGLLCLQCNAGLGQFRDRRSLLLKAVAYLDGKL